MAEHLAAVDNVSAELRTTAYAKADRLLADLPEETVPPALADSFRRVLRELLAEAFIAGGINALRQIKVEP